MEGWGAILQTAFSGKTWTTITGYFQQLVAPFFIFGISFMVLRFFLGYFKKEFQSFEDIFNFIAFRFARFAMVLFFILPVNVSDAVSTGGLPTGLWMYKWGCEIAINTANKIANGIAGTDSFRLPGMFKDVAEQSVRKLEFAMEKIEAKYQPAPDTPTVYDEQGNSYTPPDLVVASGKQVGFLEGLANVGKKGVFVITVALGVIFGSLLGGPAGAVMGLKIGALLGYLADVAVNGFGNIGALIRDTLIDFLVPIMISISYLIQYIFVIMKFVFFAPFFYFSIFYIFFDRGIDMFYANLRKWLAMLFYPSALVIAFGISAELFDVTKKVINENMDNIFPQAGFFQILVLSLVIGTVFLVVFTALVRSAMHFVDSMLGGQSIIPSGRR